MIVGTNEEDWHSLKVTRYVNYKKIIKFFLEHIKISNPREIKNLKEIDNLEIVTERYEKLVEKLEIEIERKIKMKELY